MANNEKNRLWTVVKVLLAVAAISVAAYAIYRKFFKKNTEAVLEEADACDVSALDAAEEADATADAGEEDTVEVSAEAVIANAEAMEA